MSKYINIEGSDIIANSRAEINTAFDDVETDIEKLKTIKPFFPYEIYSSGSATATGLDVTFPTIVVNIYDESTNEEIKVTMATQTITVNASSVTDIWIDKEGEVSSEVEPLATYADLPRYENKAHLYRIESDETTATLIFKRINQSNMNPVSDINPLRDFEATYIVPDSSGAITWSAVDVEIGDVIRNGNELWIVARSGTLDSTAPTIIVQEVYNGSAIVRYVGRVGYEGSWHNGNFGVTIWYFSFIAGGLFVRLGTKYESLVADLIRSGFKHIVYNYAASTDYVQGEKVKSTNYIWECDSTGTTGASYTFPSTASIGDTETDNDITWRCVREMNVTSGQPNYFFTDIYEDFSEMKYEDSHDSYGAMFAWMIEQYLEITNDWDILDETNARGQKYIDLFKLIMEENITNEIDSTSHLSRVFQGDLSPKTGSTLELRYFMDNCEVYRGLVSAIAIFDHYDSTYASYVTTLENAKDDIFFGLSQLYMSTVGCYKYEYTVAPEDVPTEGTIFYPWIMSQYWAILWDVPLDTFYYKNAIQWTQEKFPNWWGRQDIDSSLSLGAHLGLLKYYSSVNIKHEILKRADQYLLGGNVPLISDLAFYKIISAVNLDDVNQSAENRVYTKDEKEKLATIEENAEVNNITDANATSLTNEGDTSLHKHDARYYTETEVDNLISNILDYTTVTDTSNTFTFDLDDEKVKNYKIEIDDTNTKTMSLSNVNSNDTEIFMRIKCTAVPTITWWSNITWLAGSAPTLETGKTYRLSFWSEDGSNWQGICVGGWSN